MEQENSFPETSLQQDSPVQQPSQIPSQQKPSNSKATDIVIESLGPEDMSLSQLLKACKFKEALSSLEAQFNSQRVNLGESNLQLVPLLHQMAEVQIALAQYSKAADLSRQSEQILQNHQEDPDYNSLAAQTYQSLAIISREKKFTKEALDLIDKSLRLSPLENLQNLEKYRAKALILCDLQQYKEAIQEIQRGVDIVDNSENIIDDIVKARVYNTLGGIRSAFSDWQRAKSAYETAMEICKKNGLSLHIEMAKACEGLGRALIETKTVSTVVQSLAESALEIYEKCFGEDPHPARISGLLLLPRYFRQQKDHLKVRQYTILAIEEGQAFYDSDYERIRDLCLVAAVTGDFRLRESLATQVLETSTEGLYGRELVTLYLQQCEACLLCKDYELFETIFPEAVDAVKDVYGDVSLEMVKLYEKIQNFYHHKKQLNRRIKYLKLSIEIYKEIYGEDHIQIGKLCLGLAGAYFGKKDFHQSIFSLKQALAIQIEFYGESHPAIIDNYVLLANAYNNNEEYSKAFKTNLQILRIQEKIGDEKIYETYESFGMLYSKFGDEKSSRNCYRKSYLMARVKFGVNDARTLDTKEFSDFNDEDKDLLGNIEEFLL